jgi:hypothetical protein
MGAGNLNKTIVAKKGAESTLVGGLATAAGIAIAKKTGTDMIYVPVISGLFIGLYKAIRNYIAHR